MLWKGTVMGFLKKVFLFFRREGFRSTLIRTFQKLGEQLRLVPYRIKERLFLGRYRKMAAEHIRGKRVYVVAACIDWNIPLFQRPHQMATALAAREGAQVLFVSERQRYDFFAGILSVGPQLDVISERLAASLGKEFGEAAEVIVFKSWPRNAGLLERIPYQKLVYEYIDDISLFYYYSEDMKKKHYELIRHADLTVCTSRALYEDALPLAKKAILSPNAGDYSFFHNNKNCPPAPGLAEKTAGYECVVGYYGCLAEWFDYDLVLEVACRKPNWCFLLVGYCFDGTVSRLREAGLENIILYPAQPYAKLPSFVAAFDIQCIPFVINDITNATSPVKLFEYMATGKPILTSKLPECLRYRSVATYSGSDDFIAKAEELMRLRYDGEYLSVMEAEAKENTWAARTQEILDFVNGEKDV